MGEADTAEHNTHAPSSATDLRTSIAVPSQVMEPPGMQDADPCL
jgi:hypothetical protein